LQITEAELDNINAGIARNMEKEIWEKEPGDLQSCKKRRISNPARYKQFKMCVVL
jgi:hypothetical protein